MGHLDGETWRAYYFWEQYVWTPPYRFSAMWCHTTSDCVTVCLDSLDVATSRCCQEESSLAMSGSPTTSNVSGQLGHYRGRSLSHGSSLCVGAPRSQHPGTTTCGWSLSRHFQESRHRSPSLYLGPAHLRPDPQVCLAPTGHHTGCGKCWLSVTRMFCAP